MLDDETLQKDIGYLQSLAVETNIPIGQRLDQLEETRNDGVKPVSSHLFANKLDQGLAAGKHPSVHDVLGLLHIVLVNEIIVEFLHLKH